MESLDRFFEVEQKECLFFRDFCGLRYWGMLRVYVYGEIANAAGLRQPYEWVGDTSIHEGVPQKLLGSVTNLFSRHNPLFAKPADILFFHAPRKVLTSQGYQSPMIDTFIDGLQQSWCIMEKDSSLRHIPYTIERTVYYNDLYDLRRLAQYFIVKRIPLYRKKAIKELSSILEAFERVYDVSLSMDKLVNRLLYQFCCCHVCVPAYKRLLKRMGTKLVVEVCHYDAANYAMTQAAHALGIRVVELQHGLFGPLNCAYNFGSGCADESCLPDKIFCFGQYWIDVIRYPDKEHRLIPTGFPFFEQQLLAAPRQKTLDGVKTILVISSPKVANAMVDLALQLEKRLSGKKYKIVYKLHPSECGHWRDKYPQLENGHIQVADNPRRSIYSYFTEAYCQIGVSSMANFEGAAYGIFAFILRIQDYQESVELCNQGMAIFVDTADEIADRLEASPLPIIKEEKREHFFKGYARENILAEIKSLLRLKEDANGNG